MHASVVYVPTCPRAIVPKGCRLLIFTCQRANKRANKRAKDVPIFQLGMPKGVPILQVFSKESENSA